MPQWGTFTITTMSEMEYCGINSYNINGRPSGRRTAARPAWGADRPRTRSFAHTTRARYWHTGCRVAAVSGGQTPDGVKNKAQTEYADRRLWGVRTMVASMRLGRVGGGDAMNRPQTRCLRAVNAVRWNRCVDWVFKCERLARVRVVNRKCGSLHAELMRALFGEQF